MTGPEVSDQTPEGYEEQLLEIVSVLAKDLGIKMRPRHVRWRGRSARSPNFMTGSASDQCEFDGGEVILPNALKGKLSPAEWKPLLASQLIYERRSKITILARWLATLLLVIFAWVPAIAFLGASYGDLGFAYALSLIVPITMLATWFFSHELRKVRLNADEKAASITGPQEFLKVLEKIDFLQISDIELRKRGGFRAALQSHFPAIDARIRRVRKFERQRDLHATQMLRDNSR